MQVFSESQSTALLLVYTVAAFLLPQIVTGEPESPEGVWQVAPKTLRPGPTGSFDFGCGQRSFDCLFRGQLASLLHRPR